jgi:hypothetical protein
MFGFLELTKHERAGTQSVNYEACKWNFVCAISRTTHLAVFPFINCPSLLMQFLKIVVETLK